MIRALFDMLKDVLGPALMKIAEWICALGWLWERKQNDGEDRAQAIESFRLIFAIEDEKTARTEFYELVSRSGLTWWEFYAALVLDPMMERCVATYDDEERKKLRRFAVSLRFALEDPPLTAESVDQHPHAFIFGGVNANFADYGISIEEMSRRLMLLKAALRQDIESRIAGGISEYQLQERFNLITEEVTQIFRGGPNTQDGVDAHEWYEAKERWYRVSKSFRTSALAQYEYPPYPPYNRTT